MDTLFPKSASCITIKEEEELSHEFMKMVRKHFKVIRDPLIVNYVNEIGQKIVSAFPPQPFEYHFHVIKDHTYNAFAAPAGQIFINSGLFEVMETEEELAGILGHEIAHASCRHISQKIERSSKIGLATLAGIAAGIFLGVGGTAADAISIGSMAAGQSASLAYSRENERQADQVGLKYMTKAGYSGKGLLVVLKKIRDKEWFGADIIPQYLTTHPAVNERITYIEGNLKLETGNRKLETANRKPQTANRKPQTESFKFQRAHARLTAIYGDEDSALQRFETRVREYPADPAANYGYGLILAKTGNRKNAVIHLKKALAEKVFDPYILRDLGVIYYLDGQYQEALNILEGAISIEPSDPEGLFFLGRTRMEMKDFEAAASVFEELLEKHPDYKQALYFIGEAYGRQKKFGQAHYHLGIYYKERREYKNAVFHLKKALQYIKDADKKLEVEKMLEGLRG
ncbi:M48 family metalloprotease [Desulfobacterales bacterium HSG2]|nr:M48 family metalloprotease [Desulfobacterales bacterium HSG2]